MQVDDRERFTQEMDSLDTRLGQISNAKERVMQLPRSQWEPTLQVRLPGMEVRLVSTCVRVSGRYNPPVCVRRGWAR